MTKRMCFFDTVSIIALLLLFFTVGFHLGKVKEPSDLTQAIVTVRIERSKMPKDREDTDITSLEIKIDGKYDCQAAALGDGTITVICEGAYKDAGFLAFGAKYLTKNQPIEILGDGAYFYGRIENIEIKDAPTST